MRRSPPGEAEASPALPLDLHVLSLPLAFILSQDQTLRCYILYILFCFCLSGLPVSIFQRINGDFHKSPLLHAASDIPA